MKKLDLLKTDSLNEARKKICKITENKIWEIEEIERENSLGRILTDKIYTNEFVPNFDKSTVDGYGVKAKETQGISESSPGFFKVVEKVQIGKEAKKEILSGECAYIPTGGMIPKGADGVVMVEYSQNFTENEICLYDSISSGRNIIKKGEDTKPGESFFKKGTKIKAKEFALLSGAGIETVSVFKKPKVTIISMGDELRSPKEKLNYGEIRDINSYGLYAMCIESGMEVIESKVLKDEKSLLEKEVLKAKKKSDIVLVSGGSSKGDYDYTAEVLDSVGKPGVFTHGISLKPGKPTILGYDEESETVLIGLPGHPVAAMIVFRLIGIWLIKNIMGESEEKTATGKMEIGVASSPGQTSCLLVNIKEGNIIAPIFGKSGLIKTLAEAEGYVLIDENKEGLKEKEEVKVYLF